MRSKVFKTIFVSSATIAGLLHGAVGRAQSVALLSYADGRPRLNIYTVGTAGKITKDREIALHGFRQERIDYEGTPGTRPHKSVELENAWLSPGSRYLAAMYDLRPTNEEIDVFDLRTGTVRTVIERDIHHHFLWGRWASPNDFAYENVDEDPDRKFRRSISVYSLDDGKVIWSHQYSGTEGFVSDYSIRAAAAAHALNRLHFGAVHQESIGDPDFKPADLGWTQPGAFGAVSDDGSTVVAGVATSGMRLAIIKNGKLACTIDLPRNSLVGRMKILGSTALVEFYHKSGSDVVGYSVDNGRKLYSIKADKIVY
jgi:hypothetical protein